MSTESERKRVIYKGRYLDVTKWLPKHPGGGVLDFFVGQDITCAVHMCHETRKKGFQKLIERMDDGPADDHPVSAFDRDYLELEQLFYDRGWFEPNLLWYAGRAAIVVAFLVAAFLAPGPWLSGLFFGFFIQQSAFIAHDVCHRAAVGPSRRIRTSWFFGTVCFGLDYRKWVREHNLHHMVISRPAEDPQMNTMPHLLYSWREAAHFEQTRRPINNWERVKMGLQHIWLLPILLLYGRINVVKSDVKNALREKNRHILGAYALHFGLWLLVMLKGYSEPLYFIPIFILVTLCVSGLIHLQLILSHAYAPRLFAHEQHALGMRVQALSNQNITTTIFDDWFHGGLQHHIEHHLFPRLPRHSLAKARPLVRELCEKHHLPYRSDYFPVAVADLMRSLHKQGGNFRAQLRESYL